MKIQISFFSEEEFEYNPEEDFLNSIKMNLSSLNFEYYNKDYQILPLDFNNLIKNNCSNNLTFHIMPTEATIKQLGNLFLTCKKKEEKYEDLKKKKLELEKQIKIQPECYSKFIYKLIDPVSENYCSLRDNSIKWFLNFDVSSSQIDAIRHKIVLYRQNKPIINLIYMIRERTKSIFFWVLKYLEILIANEETLEISKKVHTAHLKEIITGGINEVKEMLKNNPIYLQHKEFYDEVYEQALKFLFSACVIELFHFENSSYYCKQKSMKSKVTDFDLLNSQYTQMSLPSIENLFVVFKNFSQEDKVENALFYSLIREIQIEKKFGLEARGIPSYYKLMD